MKPTTAGWIALAAAWAVGLYLLTQGAWVPGVGCLVIGGCLPGAIGGPGDDLEV